MKCTICDKDATVFFRLLKVAFCADCDMTPDATRILAGLPPEEPSPIEDPTGYGWGSR